MSEYVINQNEGKTFEYTYSAKQQDEIEKIRSKYLPKQESKIEQLRRLDQQAEKPGMIASLAVGIVGALILGVGMCFTMVWNTSITMFVAGIVIGIIGMAIVGLAFPLYKGITKKQRAKIADQIIALSNELSLENQFSL